VHHIATLYNKMRATEYFAHLRGFIFAAVIFDFIFRIVAIVFSTQTARYGTVRPGIAITYYSFWGVWWILYCVLFFFLFRFRKTAKESLDYVKDVKGNQYLREALYTLRRVTTMTAIFAAWLAIAVVEGMFHFIGVAAQWSTGHRVQAEVIIGVVIMSAILHVAVVYYIKPQYKKGRGVGGKEQADPELGDEMDYQLLGNQDDETL